METALLCTVSMLVISAFPSGAKAANQYDYLQFVQQWPITLCYNNPACIPGASLPLDFFIHGLWPSNFSGQNQPCVGTPFDYNEMLSQYRLRTKMLPFSWPSFTRRSNMGFWKYEYNQHGTCSENNLAQTDYFYKAYALWMRYNANFILYASTVIPGHKIVPGYLYHYADLLNSVQQAIGGFTPSLMCKHEPANNTWILHEVIICFDAMGNNVINCVRGSSCSATTTGYIHYPLQ